MPTPQNSQTHSNNSSAAAEEFSSVFGHFVGLTPKVLTVILNSKCECCKNHKIKKHVRNSQNKYVLFSMVYWVYVII